MKAIVAADENGVIGIDGEIPWHSKQNFEWFKQQTRFSNLVMGRKTYESLPTPFLVNRNIYVITSIPKPSAVFGAYDCNVHFCRIKRMHVLLSDMYFSMSVFVAGGQKIYEEFVPDCEQLFLTRVGGGRDGDTYFPHSLLETFDKKETIKEIDLGQIYQYTNTSLTAS